MRRVMACGVVLMAVLFMVSSLEAQALKIGVYDLQKVVRESKKIEGYRQQLTKDIEAKKGPLAEKEKQVRALDDRLKKDGPSLAPADRQALAEKLSAELQGLKRLREDVEHELQRVNRELTQRASVDINGAVKKIGDKENYTIIFEKNAAGVVYLKDAVDVTAKVLGEIK
jgi:outer membrane protein